MKKLKEEVIIHLHLVLINECNIELNNFNLPRKNNDVNIELGPTTSMHTKYTQQGTTTGMKLPDDILKNIANIFEKYLELKDTKDAQAQFIRSIQIDDLVMLSQNMKLYRDIVLITKDSCAPSDVFSAFDNLFKLVMGRLEELKLKEENGK